MHDFVSLWKKKRSLDERICNDDIWHGSIYSSDLIKKVEKSRILILLCLTEHFKV